MSISSGENCLVRERNVRMYEESFSFVFSGDAIERNQQLEFERNIEKLQIMKVIIL